MHALGEGEAAECRGVVGRSGVKRALLACSELDKHSQSASGSPLPGDAAFKKTSARHCTPLGRGAGGEVGSGEAHDLYLSFFFQLGFSYTEIIGTPSTLMTCTGCTGPHTFHMSRTKMRNARSWL